MTNKAITILVSASLGIAIGVVGSLMVAPRHESPYLKSPDRLGDVVAAILVMGTYKFDSMPTDKWQEYIGGQPKSAASWSDLFTQHPEFFSVDRKRHDRARPLVSSLAPR